MVLGFHYNFRLAVLINFVLIIKKVQVGIIKGGRGLIQTLSESLSFLIKMLPLLLCVSS